jgi:hypothetical protein
MPASCNPAILQSRVYREVLALEMHRGEYVEVWARPTSFFELCHAQDGPRGFVLPCLVKPKESFMRIKLD